MSLPSDCKDAADLLSLLPRPDRDTLANFERTALRSDSEVQTLDAQLGVITPYSDPLLKGNWRAYAAFLRTLDKAGMVRWSLTRRERCTPFFVKKKSGDLRLIIDARRFNRRCTSPPKTSLGSAITLTDIELGVDEQLFFAAADIQDCFHHFRMPRALQEYFGLDGLPAKVLGIRQIRRRTGGTSGYYHLPAHHFCSDGIYLVHVLVPAGSRALPGPTITTLRHSR